jgi:probable phosphoglycerate mutase
MEFVFIRHGQPAWSVDGVSQTDPHLTDLGWDQARRAADRLAADEQPLREIIVSPAIRAQQTAEPLAAATGLEPTTVDDIVEMRMPDWTGHLEADVQRIFSESRDRTPEEWWDGLPGGESFREFHDRITNAMAKVLAERGIVPDEQGRPHLWHYDAEPGRIAIVAHGGTNAVALGALLGLEPAPWEWERFILGHCSIARVRAIPLAGEHVFSLRAFNDREHLPAELRTR